MPHIQKALRARQDRPTREGPQGPLTWNRNADRLRRNKLNIDPKTVDWKAFLGTAPKQPFDEYRFRNWRWFWDFGGGIFTDLMVHWIDVVHWFWTWTIPTQATSIGSNSFSKGVWETPDTRADAVALPRRTCRCISRARSRNARNGAMIEFMGTEATLYMDRGRYEIYPERKQEASYEELVLGTGRRGLDFYDKPDGELLHLTNWIECVRSRKKPAAPGRGGRQRGGSSPSGERGASGGTAKLCGKGNPSAMSIMGPQNYWAPNLAVASGI